MARIACRPDMTSTWAALGDHWIFAADVLISKVREGHSVPGCARAPDRRRALTPDGRQRYFDITACQPGRLIGQRRYHSRQHDDAATAISAIVSLDKNWDFGLNVFGSFTYQDVWDQAAATSSIASSNYGNTAFLDPNNGSVRPLERRGPLLLQVRPGLRPRLLRRYKTSIDLFGDTRIGPRTATRCRTPDDCRRSSGRVQLGVPARRRSLPVLRADGPE